MKHQGHIWGSVPYRQAFSRLGTPINHFIECKRCGYVFRAKFPLPNETMEFLGVPTCDMHIISQVQEE